MDTAGNRQADQVYDFSVVSSLVTTAVEFISLPVAGTVGIIISGSAR